MKHGPKKLKAFSLVELLTALAIVTVLTAMVLQLGRRMVQQGKERLTESSIGIIVTALEQYYDFYNRFPFEAVFDPDATPEPIYYDYEDLEAHLADSLNAVSVEITEPLPEEDLDPYASSIALFFSLDRYPQSRRLIGTITENLVTSQLTGKRDMECEVTYSSGTDEIRGLQAFVDAWGNALRYEYDSSADSFPLITSPGPDGVFGSGDDVASR